MRRYPGNFTDSDLLSVPRFLKVRPDHDITHLAYITDSEADLLQKNKPGTPHKGPQGIPNYDGGDILTYRPSGMEGTGYQGPSQQQQQQQQQQYDQHQQQSNERQDKQDKINKGNQAAVKKAGEFATQLNKSGINTSQLGWAQSHDSVPPALASVLGIAEERWDSNTNSMRWFNKGTDEAYVPGKHKIEDFDYDWGDLGDYMTMREEGTYGGVSGNEAVVNQVKNEFLGAQSELENAKASGNKKEIKEAQANLDAVKNNLNKLGVGNIIDPGTGTFKEGFGPDPFTETFADMSFRDIEETDKYKKNDPRNIYQNKFLNIGKLSYGDPGSGIISYPNYGYGGGYGGGGWGGDYGYGGGGGGGGGGGYIEQPLTPRGNQNEAWGAQNPLQQAMINIHGGQGFQQGFKRGGIVSLVT